MDLVPVWQFRCGILVWVRRDRPPPPGYSFAWLDPYSNGWVCAPVPLNFLIWRLPWWYSLVMEWLIRKGVIILEEGDYYSNALIEWRPWRWGQRTFRLDGPRWFFVDRRLLAKLRSMRGVKWVEDGIWRKP